MRAVRAVPQTVEYHGTYQLITSSSPFPVVQLLEGRLFSEGLHVLGSPPSAPQLQQYLEAFFGQGLPRSALQAVAGELGWREWGGEGCCGAGG